jgi:hypothetical protein
MAGHALAGCLAAACAGLAPAGGLLVRPRAAPAAVAPLWRRRCPRCRSAAAGPLVGRLAMLLAMSPRRAHSRSRSHPHHGVRTPPRDARRGEAAARGGRDQHHPRPRYGLDSGSPAAGPAGRPAATPRQRAPLAVADASGRAADREVEEDFVCPVCMHTLLRQAADFEERTVKVCDTCPEEHRICRVCFRQAVTSVLNNRDAYGPHANGAVGLRCPGVTGSRRCSNLIPEQLLPLANAEETSTYTDRLLWAATPPQQRFRCPSCSAQVGVTTVDGQRMSHGQCPSCSVSLCVACQVAPFHTGMTCEVFQARGEEAKGDAERATDCFVAATSKVCPGCGEAISHYHGHQCHHISPVTDGCSNCRTHFCFQCLHVFPKGSNHRCPNGCSSFCKQENLANFISTTPVPHDTRCGCVFCPDCLPGKPCDLCDGQCVVCRGIVSSGATSMSQAAPSPAISIRAATPPRSLRPATPLRQGAAYQHPLIYKYHIHLSIICRSLPDT